MRNSLVEALELRRLLAVDLTGSVSLVQPAPYITDTDATAQINVTMRNIGSSDATILPVLAIVYLSKDKVLDTSNDIQCGDVTAPQGLKHGKKTTLQTNLNTGNATPGKYYLCAFIDAAQVYSGQGNPYVDVNRDNNIVFTDTP